MDPAKPKAYGEHYDPQPAFATGFPVNQLKTESSWSTGLFDCFSDVRNCCLTCWCPAITFGQIAEIIDEGSMTCSTSAVLYGVIASTTGCHACMYSCMYRTKMRKQYMLKERPCGDCLVHWFCECCALCQMYRELQNRGYNMQIGWQGNLERQHGGIPMTAPNVESGMSR